MVNFSRVSLFPAFIVVVVVLIVILDSYKKLSLREDIYKSWFRYHGLRRVLELTWCIWHELNVKACEMLNEAWIFLSQLRYACAKLLAGCIIINKKEAVIANSIEVYERSRTIDVHRERSSIIKGSPSQSSLPPAQTKYPNTWATVLSTTSHRQPTTNKNKITQLKTKCPQSIIKDNITEIIKLAEENEAPSILNHKAVDKHLCKLAGLLSNSIATQTMVVDQIIQASQLKNQGPYKTR